jgi:hypothetical protein
MEVNMLLSKNTLLKDYKLKSFAARWHIVTVMILAILVTSSVKPKFVHAQSASEHESFLSSWIETREFGPSDIRAVLRTIEEKRPKANPDDVKSPEAIVNATYRTLSGKKGEKRDWDRYLSLFLPDAKITSTSRTEGSTDKKTWSANEYINVMGKWIDKENYHIKQIHSVKERFGDMAHVFSTYKASGAPVDKPFERGVNSYQLWYDGERWWIYSVIWHGEREGAQLPQKYLGE